jgi:L-aminopeptidase/D-esterase-like protein
VEASVIPGVAVGHWRDAAARTGCTVVLLPPGTVASGEVRGGAPATREFELLRPERTVDRVDAVVLSGGSAFGLATADGVVRWLAERGRGFPTPAGPVPIVVGMALFDLSVGSPDVRPGAEQGYAASTAAGEGEVQTGLVGAGTGATIGRWRGEQRPAGLGGRLERAGSLCVGALVAVNAFGDVRDGSPPPATPAEGHPFTNTTLAVVVTNARLSKGDCLLVAQSAHDGFARALEPAHTRFDGDAAVAAATGEVEATVDEVRVLAARAVEEAIRAVATA